MINLNHKQKLIRDWHTCCTLIVFSVVIVVVVVAQVTQEEVNLTELTSLLQVEMTGSSIFDYVHQADHCEIAEQLGLSLAEGSGSGMTSPSSNDEPIGTNNPDG